LVFNVFSITHIKNKVSDKYKTKNIIKDDNKAFLTSKNQTRANTNSSRNLRLTETRVCTTWPEEFFDCPLKKIMREIEIITKKTTVRVTTLMNGTLIIPVEIKRNPAPSRTMSRNNNNNKYLYRSFRLFVI